MSRLLLLLLLAACAGDETISAHSGGAGPFLLEKIDGTAFPARATIAFPAEGSIRGEAPCNAYTAPQTAPYPWFEAGPIRATRTACPALAAERRYFDALAAMAFAEVTGDALILSDEAGRRMVFRRAGQR